MCFVGGFEREVKKAEDATDEKKRVSALPTPLAKRLSLWQGAGIIREKMTAQTQVFNMPHHIADV